MNIVNGIAGGIGAGTDMFDSFLHPERGYQEAEKQADKYYVDAQGRLQRYNDAGYDQYGRLQDQANRLNDPAALENEWAASYKQSPYATQQINNATENGMNAASSMGLVGSSAALNNVTQNASNIGNQDRKQYMDDLMQKYLASINIGQNLYGVGAGAANAQSNNAMSQGTTQANLKYGEINAPGERLADIAKAGINYATGSQL